MLPPPPVAALGAAATVAMLASAWARIAQPAMSSVPLLNLTHLDTAALQRAATDLGIFRLVGHGVDVGASLDASRAFFELPELAKASARSASGAVGGFQRGYIPLAGESGLRENVEVKEGFCYGREPDPAGEARLGKTANATEGLRQLISPNAWPDGHAHLLGAAWAPLLLQLVDRCAEITDTLHRALSAGMGRDPSHLGAIARGGEDISLMRLFHYFSNATQPGAWPGLPRIGSSAHTDWHLLTIVVQDTTGGLQVRRASPPFEWVDVPAVEGELVVIVGDYLSALSGGRYTSPVHRVLLPPAGSERFSFTYFRYPHYDSLVPHTHARSAQRRAARRARQRRRVGGAAVDPFNTLVHSDAGEGLERLSSRPFGEMLLDKWRSVAANKA
jgi:isopenicillin N synthase-like dioxygenase